VYTDCEQCGKPCGTDELYRCPYLEAHTEILEGDELFDETERCNCCMECRMQCAMDI